MRVVYDVPATGKVNAGNYIHGGMVGGAATPEYAAWAAMQARVKEKPGTKRYKYYAGRGVSIWSGWLGPRGFKVFLAHVGPKPSPKHSLDRYPNNNGNYEPGNVRWATPEEQSQNRRLSPRCRRGHLVVPENRISNGTSTGCCRPCRRITDEASGRKGHR